LRRLPASAAATIPEAPWLRLMRDHRILPSTGKTAPVFLVRGVGSWALPGSCNCRTPRCDYVFPDVSRQSWPVFRFHVQHVLGFVPWAWRRSLVWPDGPAGIRPGSRAAPWARRPALMVGRTLASRSDRPERKVAHLAELAEGPVFHVQHSQSRGPVECLPTPGGPVEDCRGSIDGPRGRPRIGGTANAAPSAWCAAAPRERRRRASAPMNGQTSRGREVPPHPPAGRPRKAASEGAPWMRLRTRPGRASGASRPGDEKPGRSPAPPPRVQRQARRHPSRLWIRVYRAVRPGLSKGLGDGSRAPARSPSRCPEVAVGPILPPSMPLVGRTPSTGVPFHLRY